MTFFMSGVVSWHTFHKGTQPLGKIYQFSVHYYIAEINRPGVAGAVLQTALSLID